MADNYASYHQQVAAMRQQKRQEEWAADYNQDLYGHDESLRNRQQIERQFATTTDPDEQQALKNEWHYYDAEVQRCEQEIRQKTPPQQPQMDPKAAQWISANKAFFDRHGPQAVAAVQGAHAWLTRPGNAEWKVNSPEYFQAVESLLETDGPRYYGVSYDPKEKMLTPNQVCRMTGIDANTYNQAYAQLKADGRVK